MAGRLASPDSGRNTYDQEPPMSATFATKWSRATELAAATPASRNRYVDFLRAVSIAAVVVGHWLMSAPVITNGDLTAGRLLVAEPWTHWLTWAFQVMPIFFVVGGYANAASWTAAVRRGDSYTSWLSARLRRLITPAVPLVALWSGFVVGARAFGIDGGLLRLASQVALIPLWFLATYVVVAAATPVADRLWRRFGFASIAAMLGAAGVVDMVRFATSDLVGWANFAFVWGAMHQLGFAWRDGRPSSSRRAAAMGVAALAALGGLVAAGPYAVAMVGVAGANNSPPTIALAALGVAQTGFLLAAERPIARWLRRPRPWAATIAVNGSIMTLYLWHLTAMVVVIGLSLLTGGAGLGIAPSTAAWWWTRPLWLLVLTAATVPFLGWFAPFERPAPSRPIGAAASAVVVACACIGFANTAGGGIANAEVWLRPEAVGPVLIAGAILAREPDRLPLVASARHQPAEQER
jgi:fucose 4-O-acetylase-like acetyltransferase